MTNDQSSTSLSDFERYLHAFNSGDIDTCLAMLHDQYVFHDDAWNFQMHKSQMRDNLEWEAQTKVHMSSNNLEVSGATVRALFTETSDFFQLLGVPEKKYRIAYTFVEGKIHDHSFVYVPNGTPALAAAAQPAIAWATVHQPDELHAIYPNNQFVYTGEMARRWLALLHQWRAAE